MVPQHGARTPSRAVMAMVRSDGLWSRLPDAAFERSGGVSRWSPTKQIPYAVGRHYKQLSKAETIWRAWYVVMNNGRTSRSAQTRADIAAFAADAPKHIQRIAWQLQRGKYVFAPGHGVAIPKKNKTDKRPIVMAPIANRIVQRAILDVVQSVPAIKEKLQSGRNFGGIEGTGVPKAVKEAYTAARSSRYFIRTDIKAFFDNVPRELAISKITSEILDAEFNALLKHATTTELSNLAQLGRDGELFPLEDIGVAQGSPAAVAASTGKLS